MLTRITFALAPLALFALSAPAAAQDCDAAHATAATFAQATGDVPLGSCIAIEGIVVGRTLVADERARYRPATRENDPSSSGAVLGLYSDHHFEAPTRVRVIGILFDCDAAAAHARAANPQVITMAIGYCHYFHGRTFRARVVTDLGPAPLTRLLRADAGPDLGNLSPLSDGDVRRQMADAVTRFIIAVRTGDRTAVAAMHGGGPGGTRSPGELAEIERLIFEDATSPFAALRGTGDVSIEIFGWRAPLWADADWHAARARTGTAEAIACFSGHPNAAVLWPIDSRDADNISGRPYACTRITLSGTGADAPASFDSQQARSGVAEPR
ncbi:MAG: hypothetical protein AABZ45_06715 [Pseudomonadota bacterium]